MVKRIAFSALVAMGLFSATAASAQVYGGPQWGYDRQGGGGAGPYAPQCLHFRNYNQRQHCTQMVMSGMRPYYAQGYYATPGYYARRGYYAAPSYAYGYRRGWW